MNKCTRIFICGIALSSMLTGCTLEDETEEKIIVPTDNTSSVQDIRTDTFVFLSKKCTLGEIEVAPEVVKLYFSSIPTNSTSYFLSDDKDQAQKDDENDLKPYFYQSVLFNTHYEKCLQKVINEGHLEYKDFYLTKKRTLAKISQYFYSIQSYSDGAYWARRVINISGKNNGYLILGRVFVQNESTRDIGANLLKESAKLGNQTAKQFLFDAVSTNNVFNALDFDVNAED